MCLFPGAIFVIDSAKTAATQLQPIHGISITNTNKVPYSLLCS